LLVVKGLSKSLNPSHGALVVDDTPDASPRGVFTGRCFIELFMERFALHFS